MQFHNYLTGTTVFIDTSKEAVEALNQTYLTLDNLRWN